MSDNRTDLVLHIGLSKCGSTSIQSLGFRFQPNYLGRGGEDRVGNALTTEFLRCSPFNRFPSIGGLSSWAKMAHRNVVARCERVPTTCVLSSEVLGRPLGQSYEPLLNFLQSLNQRIWRWGSLKVIIVLRTQAQRIGSMFAQGSHKIRNANQSKFEQFVQAKIETDVSFDYYTLVDGLHRVLSPENVLVLFLEEMNSLDFWRRLSCFSGCPLTNSDHLPVSEASSNRRSVTNSVWAVRNPLDPMISRGVGNSLLTWVWPSTLLPGQRLKARNVIARVDLAIRTRRFRNESTRSRSIELTDSLQMQVRERYRVGNSKLANLLSKDLQSLGYL